MSAYIVANGQRVEGWEMVEINREHAVYYYSYMRLRASENTDAGASPPTFSLYPGDPVNAYLAGQKVIQGSVMSRQVVYNKQIHSVEIIVVSPAQNLDAATVDADPGQYVNQTIKQIVPEVCKKAGVNVRFVGDLSGTDKPFSRISEQIGERIIDFVLRLAQMRQLHPSDDENGNLLLGRADNIGSTSGAVLREGDNIEQARLLINYDYGADYLRKKGHQPGDDETNGTQSSEVMYEGKVANYKGPSRRRTEHMPEVGDITDAQLNWKHAINIMQLPMFEIVITVPGWLTDSGKLWILEYMGDKPKPISVFSPMLLPRDGGQISGLLVRAVKHHQSNEMGTLTEITCATQASLGEDALHTKDAGSYINPPGGPGTAR